MNQSELSLQFTGQSADMFHVNITFDGTDSGLQPFVNPITQADREAIRWYIETYGISSLAEPDDQEARRIESRLAEMGKALFKAVFNTRESYQCYIGFQQAPSAQRVLTINTELAEILALPWELLHDPI